MESTCYHNVKFCRVFVWLEEYVDIANKHTRVFILYNLCKFYTDVINLFLCLERTVCRMSEFLLILVLCFNVEWFSCSHFLDAWILKPLMVQRYVLFLIWHKIYLSTNLSLSIKELFPYVCTMVSEVKEAKRVIRITVLYRIAAPLTL